MSSQQFIALNGQRLELNEKVCNDLLKVYVAKGYKETGIFSIQVGADLHKNFRVLGGEEEDSTLTRPVIYQNIYKTLEHANSKGAFSLDDAAVIANLVNFVNTNILSRSPETHEEKVI